jgi:large subunit ribosomal protein L29
MKASELKNQNDEELTQTLVRLRRDLAELQVRRSQGEDPQAPMKMHQLKKDIARVLTVVRDRELRQ